MLPMRRLAIYAHYDAEGEVKPFVTYLLKELAECCERVVFVSTGDLTEAACDEARRHAQEVVVKENVGLDFGMWKHALTGRDVSGYDEVIITNSSVFGPLWPLEPYLVEMSTRPCDFWGMTENEEIEHHLQSYFLVFKKRVVQSRAFGDFWENIVPFRDKLQIIRSYEIGLTNFLTGEGFVGLPYVRTEDMFPPWPLIELFPYRHRNPTAYYPERLIDHRMPFVKVELLRDNVIDVPLEPVYRRIRQTPYPEALIAFDRAARSKKVTPKFPYFTYVQKPATDLLDRLF